MQKHWTFSVCGILGPWMTCCLLHSILKVNGPGNESSSNFGIWIEFLRGKMATVLLFEILPNFKQWNTFSYWLSHSEIWHLPNINTTQWKPCSKYNPNACVKMCSFTLEKGTAEIQQIKIWRECMPSRKLNCD